METKASVQVYFPIEGKTNDVLFSIKSDKDLDLQELASIMRELAEDLLNKYAAKDMHKENENA